MAAQQGRMMLLKMETAASTYTAVAGIRTTKFTINATSVESTDADSPDAWKELLDGAGIKSMSISGSGVFKNSTIEASVLNALLADTIKNWQAIVPGLGTFQGAYHIDSVEFDGNHDGEVTYSFSLSSAGEITFTAAS